MQNKSGTKFFVFLYIYCRSISHWKLIFQSPDTLAAEADLRDMFKKGLQDRLNIYCCGRTRSKHDGTRAETRFGLSAKWTSPFKSAGGSVQSTNGSRGVQISG